MNMRIKDKLFKTQEKADSSEILPQSNSQLENYNAFFQYLLSNDVDDKLNNGK